MPEDISKVQADAMHKLVELATKRTEMSANRTYMNAERTLSVWIRTAPGCPLPMPSSYYCLESGCWCS